VHVIEDAADAYLQAIDARAKDLSAQEDAVARVFIYVDHPCVDHIRVMRNGVSFRVQVVGHGCCMSLPPAALDDDCTEAFTEAWRGDETGGYFVLDAEAVAILTIAIERETGDWAHH